MDKKILFEQLSFLDDVKYFLEATPVSLTQPTTAESTEGVEQAIAEEGISTIGIERPGVEKPGINKPAPPDMDDDNEITPRPMLQLKEVDLSDNVIVISDEPEEEILAPTEQVQLQTAAIEAEPVKTVDAAQLDAQMAKIKELEAIVQKLSRQKAAQVRAVEVRPKSEGVRKGRIKDRVLDLLKENKKLTSTDLAQMVGLSRTRCSEYFRELTKEGLVEGVIVNRKKFYKLIKRNPEMMGE